MPANFGGSFINNVTLNEDTGTAINQVLDSRGVNVGLVPVGTVVNVQWQDGTTAKFIKISGGGTLSWSYIPGSARAKDGHPINPDGSTVQNPNPVGSQVIGGTDAPSTFGTAVLVLVAPEPTNTGVITIEETDGTTTLNDVYIPPGG